MIKSQFFTRNGGVSEGRYSSLNLSSKYGDGIESVARNQKIILKNFGGRRLIQLNQVHGADCVIVDGALQEEVDADALVTKKQGLVLGVITADCAPVLFEGNDNEGQKIVGAAHAGWRGAVAGVCENTISKMEELGCKKESIIAQIGPCIAQKSYEVSKKFIEPFINEDEHAATFFKESGEKLLFDLSGYASFRLKRAGIQRINEDGRDTYTLENEFYSFRRSTQRNEEECGRQMSGIMILNH